MKNEDLSWLCEELGLPVLEETDFGVLGNPAAQAALAQSGAETCRESGLTGSAARVMGIAADDEALLMALADARRGERGRADVGPNTSGQRWRVLATPLADARVRLTIAPRQQEPAACAPERGLVDIAAAVSHEVANAVGSIRGWAELALRAEGAPHGSVDTRDALDLIRGAARSAEQAARGMLRLARGQAHELDPQPMDLSEFASELVSLLTLTAREARVTLDSSIESGLIVHASRAQLFTMLFNLLKNAIEACSAGGLVSLAARGERDSVQVSVRDTGSGLDARTLERLFERYYTTKAHGTGLGLALVKSAADASGSTIVVDSELGHGTVFRLSLPRARRELAPVCEASAPRAPAARQMIARVLVVDDDQALREMLATALSLRGAEVISARNADEALALEGAFDIALIDMLLDDCRGDELLAGLRKRGAVNAALLVTGTVQKPKLVPGGEPDDWVRKPFELTHLMERIRRILERHRMMDRLSSGARA